MLLRRVTKHVKAQNWFAVGVDFLIVVVGILIAFQITEWNNEREAAERERAATAALLEESWAALDYLRNMLTVHDDIIARQEASIQAIIAGAMPAGMSHEEFLGGITTTRRFIAPRPPRGVYDSLMATGDMRLIRNTEIVRRLAHYYAKLAEVQEYSRRIHDTTNIQIGRYHPAIISIYDPEAFGKRRQDADFATLAADPNFLEDSVDTLRAIAAVQNSRRAVLTELERSFEALCEAAPVACENLKRGEATEIDTGTN